MDSFLFKIVIILVIATVVVENAPTGPIWPINPENSSVDLTSNEKLKEIIMAKLALYQRRSAESKVIKNFGQLLESLDKYDMDVKLEVSTGTNDELDELTISLKNSPRSNPDDTTSEVHELITRFDDSDDNKFETILELLHSTGTDLKITIRENKFTLEVLRAESAQVQDEPQTTEEISPETETIDNDIPTLIETEGDYSKYLGRVWYKLAK